MRGGTRGVFRSPNASQEPLWAKNMRSTETSRPLSIGPDFCGRLQSFGCARLLATAPIGFGAHGAQPHMHPAVIVGGPYWHSVCDGFHVIIVLGQYFRIVVIMKLRILATIAIVPLFESRQTIVAINSCTIPRSHIGNPILTLNINTSF